MKNLLGSISKLLGSRSKIKTIASIVILALDHLDDIMDLFKKDEIDPRKVVKDSAKKNRADEIDPIKVVNDSAKKNKADVISSEKEHIVF